MLVEEYLAGPEVSLFAVCDGTVAVPLLPAQDFKRVGDGDTGPNTGGMGAYAPLPWAPAGLVDLVQRRVLDPVLAEMARRGAPFSGLLYAGLVLTSAGPKVIEFNCRFGDPETQVVLELLDTPLGALLAAAAAGDLGARSVPLTWRGAAAVTVVIAAENYPGTPVTGDVITGADGEGILHAGTRIAADGSVVSAGGRVLSVVATGADLAAARENAYALVGQVHLRGSHYRTDIAAAAAEGRVLVPGDGLMTAADRRRDAVTGRLRPSARSAVAPFYVMRVLAAAARRAERGRAAVQPGRRSTLDARPGGGAARPRT